MNPTPIDPLTALLSAIAVLAVLTGIVIVRPGILRKNLRRRRDDARVHIEDALKHAYDYEEKNQRPTTASIAGALGMSTDESMDLVSRLERLGLIRSDSAGALALTPDGRSYALRVVRIHRLWERYLADETSVRESDWHREAEEQEHRMTAAQADALAAQLSNPQFDPHGDPIPSADGEVPERQGVPVTELSPGLFARVVHIEDEPQAAYAQLVALGLFAGLQIQVLDVSSARVRLAVNGEEIVLAPVIARNITVVPVLKENEIEPTFRTLAEIAPDVPVIVTGISRACRGAQRRRLMDLGIVPGTRIIPELHSLAGDPVAYVVRGTLVALRRQQAEQIHVKEEEQAA